MPDSHVRAKQKRARTSGDGACMLPGPDRGFPEAAPAPPEPGRGALSGAREQQRPTERRGVQHGELNSIACSL